MSLQRIMKGLPSEILAAKGLLYQDWSALTPCQRECITRVGMTIQLEQESYLTEHPEVQAMLEIFISKMTQNAKRKGILKEASAHFVRPTEIMDAEIRDRLGLPPYGPYIKPEKPPFRYDDIELENDLKKIILKHHPPEPWQIPTPMATTPNTVSSSFLSILTSATTLPTPEPIPTPEPTISETFFALVSHTVDKAVYSHMDDAALRYDTAYVELTRAVEDAMEVPVIEIKEDIADLFYNAYKLFELTIMEKDRIAAEMAWERRMRKKMKRTLRRLHNFKGYETPPTPKSEISSHKSYKAPPPKPCICHPQYNYNRYPKDRFGIYLPRETAFSAENVTVTPAVSMDDITEDIDNDITADTKSSISKKSAISAKSTVSKKAAAIKS